MIDTTDAIANSQAPILDGLGRFADLVTLLGTSTKTNDKLRVLVNYFETAADKDKVWVIALFTGRKPRRVINTKLLAEWCVEIADLPGWLFGESYHTVGDLAETISLLLPDLDGTSCNLHPLHFYIEQFRQIERQDEAVKKNMLSKVGVS